MAARFDFVPTSRNKTRCLGLGMSCTRSDGGSPTFNRRMSTLPSFLISPKAAPRRLDNGREASPVAAGFYFKLGSPFFPAQKKHRLQHRPVVSDRIISPLTRPLSTH